MIRGLYISASAMLAEMVRNDVTANNLANVSTTGYKKDVTIARSFGDMLVMRVNDPPAREAVPVGKLGKGAVIEETATRYSQGVLRASSSPYDMAIQGDGFFVVENDQGEFLTRNGSFLVDSAGYLVTSDGFKVLGEKGPIHVGLTTNFTVDDQGNMEVDNQPIGRLRLETVADKKLMQKVGDSLFTGGQATLGITGQVKQKFIEDSNVNPVQEMVDMITIMRAYEANQKIIAGHDQTLSQAIEIGRLR